MELLLWIALIFGVAALVFAVFGFGRAASVAADIAKIAFAVFLIIFLVLLILALVN